MYLEGEILPPRSSAKTGSGPFSECAGISDSSPAARQHPWHGRKLNPSGFFLANHCENPPSDDKTPEVKSAVVMRQRNICEVEANV